MDVTPTDDVTPRGVQLVPFVPGLGLDNIRAKYNYVELPLDPD